MNYTYKNGDTDFKLCLRVAVSQKHFVDAGLWWDQWGESGTLFARLFGYEDYTALQAAHYAQADDGVISKKLEALVGPYGDTIFAAMKIRLNR